MRRIKVVLAAVAAMLVMIAVGSGSATAQDLSDCEFVGYNTFGDEQYLCVADEDGLGEDLTNCEFVGYDRFDRELYLCEVDEEEDENDNEFADDEEDEDDDSFTDNEDDEDNEEEDFFDE
jgi:hypothetical protein